MQANGQNQSHAQTLRQQRGLEIARNGNLRHKGDLWFVPSQSGRKNYKVLLNPKAPRCTCPDFELRGGKCKHIHAVEYTIRREFHNDGTETVTETVKVTYRQDWKAYNKAQTQEKELFQVLMARLCQGLPEPPRTVGKSPGGRRPLPFRDMVFSAAFKVYSTFSARRFATDLREAEAKRLISKSPHFNSVLNTMERLDLTPVLSALIVKSSLPLKAVEVDFAPDSSGFATRRFINWHETKYKGHGGEEHDWIKVHLMTGVKTNTVTAVEIGGRHTADSFMFPYLVNHTAENFKMREVSADKAYLSHDNLDLVEEHGATPFIPFKSNTALRDDGDTWSRMYHYFAFNREEFMAHYHKRSNVESTFNMIKAKFGDYVRSKTPVAQINEVLCKVLCHNVCVLIQSMYELGIKVA